MRMINAETYNHDYEVARKFGYNKALEYILNRGEEILENENLDANVAIGICVVLGIAEAELKKRGGIKDNG